MLPGPDYYHRCPSCSTVAYQKSIATGNTIGAVYWSDAKREAPMLPEFPALVVCPNCNVYLWIKSLKPIGEFNRYPAVRQVLRKEEKQEPPAEWATAPQFRAPDAKNFAQALYAGLADTPELQRYLRLRLWWSLNDRHRRADEGDDVRDDATFRSNLDRLATLLDDSANDTLLRAEIARESGRFRVAVELCDALVATSAEAYLKKTSELIRARAIAEDVRVFRLDSTES
jgi:hypothetical protein